ncbi:hypothetical protein K2173_018749 [Erythroxylum novogranatense]|uniref:Uncharacterized protein n=1 Tax=Erythroxylum novogranatense TaxID=1862640 RepID=A0AAV8SB23_9ROSI|nr:hypothetical protein K2173_018749 [Erythroxylum novogranatense]
MNIHFSTVFLLIALALVRRSLAYYKDEEWHIKDISRMHTDQETRCDGDYCIKEVEEMTMESDTRRRILAQATRYISYGALLKNKAPCNRRGKSYYNCSWRGKANPYTRGCSVITHCYRFTN